MDRRDFLYSSVGLGTVSLVMSASLTGTTQAETLQTTQSPPSQEKPKMNTDKPILIAADPFAVALKDAITAHLKGKDYQIIDLGATTTHEVPYYDGAVAVCRAIQAGQADRGILFCGTGMGMSVIANRFRGVVAAVVESVFAAQMSRTINNANVLCLGSMIWGEWMAKEAVDTFLNTQFTEGLEPLSDFLRDAEKKVNAIRD